MSFICTFQIKLGFSIPGLLVSYPQLCNGEYMEDDWSRQWMEMYIMEIATKEQKASHFHQKVSQQLNWVVYILSSAWSRDVRLMFFYPLAFLSLFLFIISWRPCLNNVYHNPGILVKNFPTTEVTQNMICCMAYQILPSSGVKRIFSFW